MAVHWGVGLNKRTVARFYYPKDSADMRLMIGEWVGRGVPPWCVCVCVLCVGSRQRTCAS